MSTDEKPRDIECGYCDECVLHGINTHKSKSEELKSKLDSAHAAILHLREMSQRVVDIDREATITNMRLVEQVKAINDLEHALSATSGYKEKAPSK